MSDAQITQSSQYTINPRGITLVTKLGDINLAGMFQELTIFDSIFNPCMSGTVLIQDAVGLSNKLSFDGSEILLIDIGKTENVAVIKKSFRIFKQSSRTSVSSGSEMYLLHFVSDEYILSEQSSISKAYNNSYSEIVKDILKNYLLLPDDKIFFVEQTKGIRKIILPNQTPFWCLDFCSKRAVDFDLSPTFLFFENKLGYNFSTISRMISSDPTHFINYQPKNLGLDNNEQEKLLGAKYVEVITQFDLNKNIKSGVYAGKFIGIDLISRKVYERNIDFGERYATAKHANKTPNIGVFKNKANIDNTQMFNSKRVTFLTGIFGSESKYIKEKDPTSIDSDDDTYNYILQREASIMSLMNQRLKLVMPGNFNLISGTTVYISLPTESEHATTDNSDNTDYSMSGKYLITATRQIITYEKHETIMEVATDSTERPAVYKSSKQQNDVVYT